MLKRINKDLTKNIQLDINENGTPALIYYYHHKNNSLHAFDTLKEWNDQLELFESSKWTKKEEHKIFLIGKNKWQTVLYTFQPVDSKNKINVKEFDNKTHHLYDPMSMSLQYSISGMCYLKLINII